MTEQYALIAIGTAAALLAVLLVMLRTEFQRRRPFVALVRRWIGASTRTSGIVVGLLAVVAISCFATLPTSDTTTTIGAASPAHQKAVHAHDSAPADGAVQALRAYADKVEADPQSVAIGSTTSDSSALPDVETMITKLVSRLEKQPDDARGWKMLGWSYLNTDRPDEAAKAYEAALKLEPNDAETKKGLEKARSAQDTAINNRPSDPAPLSPKND